MEQERDILCNNGWIFSVVKSIRVSFLSKIFPLLITLPPRRVIVNYFLILIKNWKVVNIWWVCIDCYSLIIILFKNINIYKYFIGESFSVADCYLFALVRWTTASWLDESIFNLPVDLSSFSNIEKWYNRVKVRPSVSKTVLYEREAKKKANAASNNNIVDNKQCWWINECVWIEINVIICK